MNFYIPINHKMDIITIALIEKHVGIPLDVLRYLNEFVKYDKLTNNAIRKAVKMWFDDKQLCVFHYGHISRWNVSKVTDMYKLFYKRTTFNEDISKWDVSNVQYAGNMFYEANAFNNDISEWNVSRNCYVYRMFYDTQIQKQHIDNWNISQISKNNVFGN